MYVDEIAKQSPTDRDSQTYYRRMVDRSLSRGDYMYAAEYCWTAYSQAVKAASSDCGMTTPDSCDTTRMAQQLTKLAFNVDAAIGNRLRTGFHAARSLYWHLYENDLTDSSVERTIADVMDAVGLLQTLFERN